MTKIFRNEPIAIIGLEYSGKSSYIHRLRTGKFGGSTKSVGASIEIVKYNGRPIIIWDMTGQKIARRNMWELFVSRASGFIFLFDASQLDKLGIAVEWFWDILGWIQDRENPLLFLMSKWDLVEKEDPVECLDHIVGKFHLHKLVEQSTSRSFSFFPISSKDGTNVYESMEWILDKLV